MASRKEPLYCDTKADYQRFWEITGTSNATLSEESLSGLREMGFLEDDSEDARKLLEFSTLSLFWLKVAAAVAVVLWCATVGFISGLIYGLVFSFIKRQVIAWNHHKSRSDQDSITHAWQRVIRMTQSLWIVTSLQYAVWVAVLIKLAQ